MIKVDLREGYILELSNILKEDTQQTLDVYLFIPADLGLDNKTIPETQFYHSGFHSRRTYFSIRPHLPLAYGRLAEQGKITTEQYRISLSLYGYQYVVGLDQLCQDIRNNEDQEQHLGSIKEVIELSQTVLNRLRRQEPEKSNLKQYYRNIDNYLSWFTEQRFLSLISHLPRHNDYKEIRNALLIVCNSELEYRQSQKYNPSKDNDNLSRLSNKMRLLRRLIEYPVTLKEQSKELGKREQKIIKTSVTAILMTIMSLAVFDMRQTMGGISTIVFISLAIMYIIREIFRENITKTLWRWLRKDRPKWRKQYFDVHSNHPIGRQLEWFDYKRLNTIPEIVRKVRGGILNLDDEKVVHYAHQTKMSPTRFLSGYEQTRETIAIDFSLLSQLMDKGSHQVYILKENQVSKQKVKKRYLINMVTRIQNGENEPILHRWKIIMSRSGIVEIEKVTS